MLCPSLYTVTVLIACSTVVTCMDTRYRTVDVKCMIPVVQLPSAILYPADAHAFKLPVSCLRRSASRYASSVSTKSDLFRTFCIVSLIHFLSSSFRTQFAHHLSMLLLIVCVLSCCFALCSASTNRRKPALYRSRPNSDRHLRMRDIRR